MRRLLQLIVSFFICSIALFLPYRLRILYSEILGRIINFFTGMYVGLMNYIIKQVSYDQKTK
ncbi:MAG: hypothetical protein ISS47_02980 [Candidatus Omnitrophica bacterium]|nr:hypothetical protein [Candidatus Omnitrophota bacterium]